MTVFEYQLGWKSYLWVAGVAVVITGGWLLYLNVFKSTFCYEKYRFCLVRTGDWRIVKSPLKSRFGMETFNREGKAVSFLGIDPVEKSNPAGEEIQKLNCEPDGLYKEFINGTEVQACKRDEQGESSRRYYITGPAASEYDYIISTGFPTGDETESQKIKEALKGFSFN